MKDGVTFVAIVLDPLPAFCVMPWCDGLLKDHVPVDVPRHARCSRCGLRYEVAAVPKVEPPRATMNAPLTATLRCSTWRLTLALSIVQAILFCFPSPRLADFFLSAFERYGLRLLTFRMDPRRTR